ncbi:hypothetical protein PRK78_003007 [Emydomyces testavorans]|uniref:Uncharacterized protein n=1 Tax=Emydomyces testavorans TaxID=2070801 RepID=A0AAF0DFC1_9EURO|nr:hypothetical protein PRK78_003007 [Emydomyces testavorans]
MLAVSYYDGPHCMVTARCQLDLNGFCGTSRLLKQRVLNPRASVPAEDDETVLSVSKNVIDVSAAEELRQPLLWTSSQVPVILFQMLPGDAVSQGTDAVLLSVRGDVSKVDDDVISNTTIAVLSEAIEVAVLLALIDVISYTIDNISSTANALVSDTASAVGFGPF